MEGDERRAESEDEPQGGLSEDDGWDPAISRGDLAAASVGALVISGSVGWLGWAAVFPSALGEDRARVFGLVGLPAAVAILLVVVFKDWVLRSSPPRGWPLGEVLHALLTRFYGAMMIGLGCLIPVSILVLVATWLMGR